MVSYVAFCLVAVPVAFCLGFSAATISFTAWNVSVPLFMNIFGFSIRQSMFLSVAQDFFNAFVLSLIYGRYGKVDWKYGALYGVIGAAFACSIALALSGFIEKHEELLESYMFVVPFILGIGFTIKGAMVLRRRMKAASGPITWREALTLKPAVTKGSAPPDPAATLSGAAARLSAITLAPLLNMPAVEQLHEPIISPTPTSGAATPAAVEDLSAADEFDDDVILMSPSAERSLSTVHATGFADFWKRFRTRFASKEDILRKRMMHKGMRMFAMGIFTTVMACISGVLFFGGGMAFALATASIFSVNVRTATGTACFMCAIIMFALLMTFIDDTDGTIRTFDTLTYACVIVPLGILGSIAGAKLSMRISDIAIFFFISAILYILGIVITVQRFAE